MANQPVHYPDMEGEISGYGAAGRNAEINTLLSAAGGLALRKKAIKHAAFKIFQLVGGGWLPRGNAEDALWPAARKLGVSAEDCRLLIDKGAREGMAKPRQPRTLNLAVLIELAEERYDFSGNAGATDYAMFCAHLRIATRLGSLTYGHSCRQLGEEAGIGAMGRTKAALTVSNSNRRLEAGGLVRCRWKGRNGASSEWELPTPGTLMRRPLLSCGNSCRGKYTISRVPGDQPLADGVLLATHPVWDRRVLGPTRRRIYAVLVDNALTVAELAEVLAVHRGTISRNLPLMDEYFMVREILGHWTATGRDLDDVADVLNAPNVRALREQAHREQRQDYRGMKQLRRSGANPKTRVVSIMEDIDPITGEVLEPEAIRHSDAPST